MQVGSISGGSPYVNVQDGSVKVKEKIAQQIEESSRAKEQEKASAEKDPNVAVSTQSAQGDDLKVTKDGMESSKAGGTVQENSVDGVVAKKEDIRVTTNTDAAKILKEQIEKNKEQAKEERISGQKDNKEAAYKPQAEVDLTGKTKEQVEQLYLKGEISRYEYDKKMEENKEENVQNSQAADKQSELVKEVAGKKEEIMENKALFEASENGNQDIMAAAMNLGKIE